jgi:class 3 adenylate cyclase
MMTVAARSDGSIRAVRVVETALDEVADHGERVFAVARVAICGSIAVMWPFVVWTELKAGGATAWMVEGVVLAAFLLGLLLWGLLVRRGRTSPTLAVASILIDTGMALSLALGVVLAPPPDYIGAFHVTGQPIVYLAVVGAGLRLTRTNAVVAGVVVGLGMLIVYVVDHRLNAAQTMDGPVHIVIVMILTATATAIGWLMAVRTRKVALAAANYALAAERARAHLGTYVSTEVAELSMKSDEVSLGGKRLTAAILFTDLRSFTSKSESTDPEHLVAELNEYFTAMVACINDEGGVVDKFIGDSIMAVFGVPASRGDDAGRALRAAAAMQVALAQLNTQRAHRGLAALEHGIGIHLGEVIAGNIGTAERSQYTVIGDAVNVAARLESETKKQGVTVLFSQAVVDAALLSSRPPVRPVGDGAGIVVKGREQAVFVQTLA